MKADLILDEDMDLQIVRKRIKRMNLVVHADGRVRVSVPLRMSEETVRAFLREKRPWIEKQKQKFADRQPPVPQHFETGEIHSFFGDEFPLEVIEWGGSSTVLFKHGKMYLLVRQGTPKEERKSIVDEFYRVELMLRIQPLAEEWQRRTNLRVNEWRIRAMRTRWGTCNYRARRIWLSLELAKWPLICLEYVIVHELMHLYEPNHSKRFYALMDQHLPTWREAEALLRDR